MSIDYFTCKHCGEAFPDCNYYVSCDCGNCWCSDECAIEDGYIDEHCLIHADLDNWSTMKQYRKTHHECFESNDYCAECKHYAETSCKYCREEDFDDSELLVYACEMLGITRDELVEKYKKEKV